jgi:hypothetical protein
MTIISGVLMLVAFVSQFWLGGFWAGGTTAYGAWETVRRWGDGES